LVFKTATKLTMLKLINFTSHCLQSSSKPPAFGLI